MSKVEKIKEMWESGKKQIEIAKELKTPESYVSKVLAPLKKKKKQPRDKPPKIVIPKVLEKHADKCVLIKYILALNKGHKGYEEYGFTDNHAFLSEIIKMVYDL